MGLVEATFLTVPIKLRGESCVPHLSKACNGLLNCGRHFFAMRLPRLGNFKTHDCYMKQTSTTLTKRILEERSSLYSVFVLSSPGLRNAHAAQYHLEQRYVVGYVC